MKKKTIITILCICLLAVLFVPRTVTYKDGGTVEHKSIVYSVQKLHRLTGVENEYEIGTIVKILGLKIYENTENKIIYDDFYINIANEIDCSLDKLIPTAIKYLENETEFKAKDYKIIDIYLTDKDNYLVDFCVDEMTFGGDVGIIIDMNNFSYIGCRLGE